MWYIIPLAILVLSLVTYLMYKRKGGDFWGAVTVVLWVLLVCAVLICPINYYTSRVDALTAERYYASFLLPNAIAEDKTTITVSGQVAGIWQAGVENAVSYNSQLVENRYWIKVPIINTAIYPLPDYLKYVIVK